MKSGTNSALMREKNEKTILSLIRRAPTSRAALAKRLGLTRAAVSIIVDELIAKGYIRECEAQTCGVGRKPLLLSFDGQGLYAVGINVTRSGFTVGIVDFDGRVLLERSYAQSSAEYFFEHIAHIVRSLVCECRVDGERIYGVGVVTPGPVDLERERVLNVPNFDSWANVAVAERLAAVLSQSIRFSSVSRAVALAEKYYGVAGESENFAVVLVNRDGIGSGIVLGDKLFRGNTELGHTSICHDGIACECGNRGCLEKYASLSSVVRGTPYPTWRDALMAGDASLIAREAGYLSVAIINTVNAFDIDTVILSGDVCEGIEPLLASIREQLGARSLRRDGVRVLSGAPLSESLVAAALIVDKFFSC